MELLRKKGENDHSYYWRWLYNREICNRPFPCDKLAYDRLRFKDCQLYQTDLLGHFGCVNAIEFSHNENFIASGGDDRRVLLWNVQKSLHKCEKEVKMNKEHSSNIFCLAFNNSDDKIYSTGNDRQIFHHDIETGDAITVFSYDCSIYGISVDPFQDNVFTVATEDGKILLFDLRRGQNYDPLIVLENRDTLFHSVTFNPVKPTVIAAGNSKNGCLIADIRGRDFALYKKFGNNSNCVSVTWNSTGKQLLALRRRKGPILYEYADRPKLISVFNHNDYRNSCTMKSSSFGGLNDEYVMSGSDDFNVYLWKISDGIANGPDKETDAHLILKGHRSIPNQVRFNKRDCLIASSGVEKMIKIWSPLNLPYSSLGPLKKRAKDDDVPPFSLFQDGFSHHDYSNGSIAEDKKMIAFFNTLIERDRNRPTSDSSSESSGSSTESERMDYEEEVQSDDARSFDGVFDGFFEIESPPFSPPPSPDREEEVIEREMELPPISQSSPSSEETRSASDSSSSSQSSKSFKERCRKRKMINEGNKRDVTKRMVQSRNTTCDSETSSSSSSTSSSSSEEFDSGVSFSHSPNKVKFKRTAKSNRNYRSRPTKSDSDSD